MNTPDFSSITLAKAIPAPAHQGNPNHNLTNGQFAAAPAYSTQISNLEEANAYWEKHFVDKGRHHHIECRFGTKSYRFTVKFARNHSFTKNTNGKHGVKYDHLREFDIDRAKAMDAIWQVLRNPSVVNWSETDPRNKQFDKQLDFVSVRFGRVILSPTPTKDDIKAGKVSAFEFVSWHEPTRQQFSAAQKRMSNVRVTPTQMKKAHSDEQAFLLSRTSINLPKGSRAEVLPVSEGFPLDWTSCFQGSHSRNSFESDSLTGSGGIMVEPEQICKSIPTPAQAEAGNYAKRKMAWHSLTISIENEPGSIRCGIDPNGKAWKTKMIVPYGYINGSIGMDSDQIDIFFGSNSDADVVYLVNQLIPPSFAKVDEQKCMLNFSSEAAARAAYLKHYDDPRFLGPITAMPVDEFVEKARKANGRMVKSHIPTYTKRDGTVVPAHDDKRMAAKPHAQSNMIFREDTGGDQVVVFPYASGMSARRDMSATIESSAGLGTEVSQLSKNGMSMIADAIADGKPVFVDSGAFNAFKRSIREGGNAAGVNFDKVFDKYDELSEKVREKSRNHDLLMLVAPDVVGDQMATLSLIVKHADRICNWIDAGHEVIIPFQRGKMGQYDMFLNVKMVLNDRPFVVGIPSAAAALGNEDLNELLSHPYKPDRIHILGAISSRRMMERMAVIRDAYEDDVPGVTADAMVMRSKLHEIGGMTGEVKFDKIKEILNRVVPAMWGGAMPDLQKSILIEFDNGNEYLLGDGQFSFGDDELRKAEALGAGQRWITVHPNGKDGKGVPVMVQETQHGSGVFHVIGGAGGKLNYLKLRGLKPESSYKEHAAEKAKARRTGQKVQRARDKELGLDKAKGKAREEVKSQKVQADKSFIQKVAEKMGWKPADLEPNIPENVSDATQKKLAQQHHGELLKRANAAVELQHQNLLTDAMAREEAGGVSVEPDEHTPPDQLDISDLDDSRPQEKAGLGFAAHYAERAAENGADESVVKQEADAKKETRQAQMTDGQRAAIKTRGDVAQQVKSEIAAIREPVTTNVKAVLADAKDAVELIKAQKEWKATQKAASAANKDIDTATEVKAYNLEVSAVDDADIANELENDLRTIRTKAFLSAVGKDVPDPEKQLRQHISAGAFNSINALAVTAGGNALIDRSVVDVLGVEGAAQVLARRLHADLPADEMSKLTDGMEAFHLHHYMETSKDALQEAKDLHDAAAEIKLGDASHGGDFEAARELLHRRNEAVEHAHKILGTALGEMEANAALVTALKGGRSDKSMEVPLGKVSDEDAIRQVRAIGLQRGDYAIERVAGNQVLTITPEGLDRLAKPVDREELERTRNTLDILNGGQDEDDWLPQGFAKRPDLAMDLKPGVAETLAKPFKPSGDMQQSLKDYIGGRAADGDSPADIVADIQSSDFFQKSGNEGAYREALEAVAPLKGEDGKMARAESLTDSFNEYADSLVKREYGGKISTLQRQNFEPDHVAQDALHRALADHPEGISAYKPIGELTNDDQQALRKFFYANVAHESPEAASLRERLDSMAHTEPEKESEDMFGEVSVNPEWQDWKSQRDTLAEEVGSASLNWSKYTDAMGGHTSAYATMQDMIRSKVGKSFNENYNKLNPSAPLKMGRQVVRGNLNHLDAVDPKARAAREAKERELVDGLRERSQGKYASGSVSDKLDAAREQEEAFNQSQMGFFSTEQDDMFGGSGASDAPKVEKPLGADERYTLGHAAERTIASMMGTVGQNFKPGQPLKIFSPTMSGPDGVMRQRAIKIIAQNKRVILAASAGCVYGGTMLSCEETGREMSFYDWWLSGERLTVKALNKENKVVLAKSETPVFIKGYEEMFLVTLQSGASVMVTAGHRFLKNDNEWMPLDRLSVGDYVVIDGLQETAKRIPNLDLAVFEAQKSHQEGVASFDSSRIQKQSDGYLHSTTFLRTRHLQRARLSVVSLFHGAHQSMQFSTIEKCHGKRLHASDQAHQESIAESYLKAHGVDDRYFYCKAQDCLGCCSVCSHQCDEQPHYDQAGSLAFETPQVDAHECNHFCLNLGGLDNAQECSHLCQLRAPRAKTHSLLPDSCLRRVESFGNETFDPQQQLHSRQELFQSRLSSCLVRSKNLAEHCGQCEPACSSLKSQSQPPSFGGCLQQSDDSHQLSLRHGLDSCLPNEMQQERLDQDTSDLPCYSPIISIISCGYSIVFDITIGEHSNYFAHGILHHNSGKTAMFLGSFSHLQSQGKVKKGVVICPSIVQGQVGAEALRFMEPGKYKWHCDPGCSFEDRLAAYKDPETHFSVVTHQSFRDDILKMAAMKSGEEPGAIADRMDGMTRKERADFTKAVLDHHGINFDFSAIDEGHGLLDRAGKDNSRMSNVIGGVTDNTGYTVSATADPVKNDISEAFSHLEKMDSARYNDRDAFMRRYGVDTQGSKDALKRELIRHVLPFKIEPKVRADKKEIQVEPSEEQSKALTELDKNIGKVRMARMEGKTDIEAMKAISPSQFKNAPESEHEAIAKELAGSLGIIKGSAVRAILDSSPDSAKIDALAKIATDRKGKPGVVFAHSLEAVENIRARLEKDGHRVMTLTGADSSEDKAAKIRGFNPEKGDRTHDIIVCSDAGSTGANLQSGSWLTQFDTSQTAMVHAQRNARIHRIGQKQDIELMDLVANHPSERKARERIKEKYELRELMSSSMEGLDDTGLAYWLHQRKVAQQQESMF